MGIELLSLMMLTANKGYFEKKTKKMFASKGELTEIYNEEVKLMDQVEKGLNEEEFEDLLEAFKFKNEKESSYGLGLWYYIFLAKGVSIEEFLSWLNDLDKNEYFKYYFFGVVYDIVEEDITKENILDILEKYKVKKSERSTVVENFYSREEKLDKLKKTVEIIYNKVFKKNEKEIEEKIKKISFRIEEKIKKYGIESLEIPNVKEGEKLFVSYIYVLSIMSFNNITIIGHRLLGSGNKDRFGIGNTLDLLKILSDETRLTILELLKGKKMYAKEIVDSLKLAKSTVSYHMESMFILGIVEYEKIENKVYYKVNMKKYERLLDEIKEKLLKIE